MVDRVTAMPEGTRLLLLAPVVRDRKGEYRKELAELQRRQMSTKVIVLSMSDQPRNVAEALQPILDGFRWLGIDWDGDTVYQFARAARHREVAEQLLATGKAYRCYATPEELDAMKAEQETRGEKRRYDGRWRPEPGKVLSTPPAGVAR
jgi:glutamyl-tRNA synthetase